MSDESEAILYQTDYGVIRRKDIEMALRSAGVSRGDVIMVHSDAGAFGKLGNVFDRKRFLQEILEAFLGVITEAGTLIAPTYTYSFCRKEVFDVKKSASNTGLFSEFIRQRPGSLRSEDPIFSHAGFGPAAHELLDGVGNDCFGANSFFDRFYGLNGKLINFGKFFDITFIHYIEQKFGVDYRYMKRFSGQIFGADGAIHSREVDYYVRALPEDGMDVQYDMPRLGNELERRGLLRRSSLGASFILGSQARDCFDVGVEMLRGDMYAFLRNRPKSI
jgi:aminoglycoside 3-N-acetyltransferase